MLITLKSDNDTNANLFTNFMPEGLMIEPDSEVGLLNASYKIGGGYVIGTGNDNFQLRLGPENVLTQLTVPPGSYADLAALSLAIQNTIHTHIGTLDDITQACYPLPTMSVAVDGGDNKQLTFSFKFDPIQNSFQNITLATNLDVNPSNATTNTFTDLQIAGITNAGGGGPASRASGSFYKTGQANTYALSGKAITVSGDGVTNFQPFPFGAIITQTGGAGPSEFYVLEFMPTGGCESLIGISANSALAADEAVLQLRTTVANEIEIYEYSNNAAVQIAAAGQSFVIGDQLRLIVPAQHHDPDNPTSQNAIYQKVGADGSVSTFNLVPTPDRFTFHPNSRDIHPVLSIKTPRIIRQLPKISILGTTGCVVDTGTVLTTGGISYSAGEVCTTLGGTGSGCEVLITSTGATGTVTGFSILKSGNGYTDLDVLSLVGTWGAQVGSFLSTITVAVAAAVTNKVSGSGYTEGETITDSTYGIQATVGPTTGTGNIGVLTITNGGTGNITPGETITFSLGGTPSGNPTVAASFDAQAVDGQAPSIKAARTSTLALNPTYAVMDRLSYTGQEFIANEQGFRDLINLNSTPYTNTDDLMTFGSTDDITFNQRTTNNILVHLDNFPIKSKHKGGQGKAIASIPFGDNGNANVGLFHVATNWLVYHSLENKEVINANEIVVRLTDNEGALIQGIEHPVIIDLDLRPRTR